MPGGHPEDWRDWIVSGHTPRLAEGYVPPSASLDPPQQRISNTVTPTERHASMDYQSEAKIAVAAHPDNSEIARRCQQLDSLIRQQSEQLHILRQHLADALVAESPVAAVNQEGKPCNDSPLSCALQDMARLLDGNISELASMIDRLQL